MNKTVFANVKTIYSEKKKKRIKTWEIRPALRTFSLDIQILKNFGVSSAMP